MKTPAPPAATDHEDDAEAQEDALCRACARARTTVVPALGRALDHPLAQLLTGLLTVFALFAFLGPTTKVVKAAAKLFKRGDS